MNADIKLLATIDYMDKKFKAVTTQKGDTGPQGPQGDKGDKGAEGSVGKKGSKGDTGAGGDKGDQGKTGKAGDAGTHIVDVSVDFDNRLTVYLSDGSEIDAGELNLNTALGGSVNVAMGGSITAPLPSIALVTTSYTSLTDPLEQIIKCTNSVPIIITMHPSPTQGQRRTIKRFGTGSVTVDGGTVDGELSTELGVDVSVQLIYIEDSWIII